MVESVVSSGSVDENCLPVLILFRKVVLWSFLIQSGCW